MKIFRFWAPKDEPDRWTRKKRVWIGRRKNGWYALGRCSMRPVWDRKDGFTSPGVTEEVFCAFTFEAVAGFKLKLGAGPVEVKITVKRVAKKKRKGS